MPNPDTGTTIGPYQIEGSIGAGSMGDVFRGIDVSLNRKVALKILSEKHKDSPELRARFVREGRAVAAIQHPNVVQVFTTGTYDDRPFIAMEFLDGTDLGSIIEENGPLSNLSAARMVLDAARGLEAAASAGLIHRDVKPSNLVRLTNGRVKVTDFGLAKPVDPGAEPALTALGVVVGTPDYIAPEQARGEQIDERVDIYALGGTLYYLLVGTPPFRTGKPAEDKYLKVVARHLRQPPPDARAARPDVDDDLAELARQMMAKKPADRPDYGTLIGRLEAIVTRLTAGGAVDSAAFPRPPDGSGGMVAKTPFVGTDAPPAFRDDVATSMAGSKVRLDPDLEAPRSRLPGWLLALTAMSVVLLVAGVVAYLMRGSDDAAASGPAPGASAETPPDAAARPTPDAAPKLADPAPPTGMALVKRADGTPWFFVDVAPVTHGAYAKVFPKQKKASAELDPEPVTGVAYNFARAYAQSLGQRLMTAAEYDAALATSGVEAAPPGLWEWVDEGSGDRRSDKRVVRAPGRTATRAQTGQKDVTFRLAQDVPAR